MQKPEGLVKEKDLKSGLTTQEGVSIDSRINSFRTLVFKSHKYAKQHSIVKRSYVYNVFSGGKSTSFYAVPN